MYTDLSAPTSPPQNLLVTILSSSSANIEWSAPPFTEQNGLISHYIITLYAHETGESVTYNVTLQSLHLNNLHPFYTYDYRVAAITIGPGPNALTSFQMNEDGKILITLTIICMYVIHI